MGIGVWSDLRVDQHGSSHRSLDFLRVLKLVLEVLKDANSKSIDRMLLLVWMEGDGWLWHRGPSLGTRSR